MTIRSGSFRLAPAKAIAIIIPSILGLGAAARAESGRHEAAPAWKQDLKTIHAEAHQKVVSAHLTSPAVHGKVQAAQAGRSYPGSPYTIENLIARVELNPARFARYHGVHTAVIIERDIQFRAMLAQGKCLPMGGPYNGGLLAQTPYHRYLEYRRSLNPNRFDYYHKVLGPILAEDERLRAISMSCVSGEMLTNMGPTLPGAAAGIPSGTESSGGGLPLTGPGSPSGSQGGVTFGSPPPTSSPGPGTPPPGPGTPPAVPAPAGLVLMAIGSVSLMIGKGWATRKQARIG